MANGVGEPKPLAVEQRIKGEEGSRPRWWVSKARSTGRRKPVEVVVENDDPEQRQQERWRGCAEEHEDPEETGSAVFRRSCKAEDAAQHDGKQQPEARQFKGRWQVRT